MLSVTVRLINAETDTAVANARLSVTDEKNGQPVPTSPDSLGFTLSAPPGTTLLIRALAPAYLAAETRIVNLTVSQRVILKLTHTKPSVLTIKVFAVKIDQPLSAATAVITSRTTGKSERFTLKNGRLERRFAQPDNLDIQVSSPGYTSVHRQMSIEVPPSGNRYEFDAELDKIMVEQPAVVTAAVTIPSAVTPTAAVTTQPFGLIEKGKSIRLNKIYFDQSSPVLRPESYAELDQLYDVLTHDPSLRIEIRGHTDNQGEFDLNTQLSRDRCQAVIAYLIKKGIRKARLNAVGRGPLDPVAPNNNEENRRKNRRVEFVVL